jgi:hypothetical protein
VGAITGMRTLEKRKAKLEKILARTQGMRLSEHLDGDGELSFARKWGR